VAAQPAAHPMMWPMQFFALWQLVIADRGRSPVQRRAGLHLSRQAAAVRTFGPHGCISVEPSDHGTCVLRTSCAAAWLESLHTTFFCQGEDKWSLYEYSPGALAPRGVLDAGVPCRACAAPQKTEYVGPRILAKVRRPRILAKVHRHVLSGTQPPPPPAEAVSTPAEKFGPGDCVQIYRGESGTCMVETACGEADLTKTAFGFRCEDADGGVAGHTIAALGGSEVVDTGVACAACLAPARPPEAFDWAAVGLAAEAQADGCDSVPTGQCCDLAVELDAAVSSCTLQLRATGPDMLAEICGVDQCRAAVAFAASLPSREGALCSKLAPALLQAAQSVSALCAPADDDNDETCASAAMHPLKKLVGFFPQPAVSLLAAPFARFFPSHVSLYADDPRPSEAEFGDVLDDLCVPCLTAALAAGGALAREAFALLAPLPLPTLTASNLAAAREYVAFATEILPSFCARKPPEVCIAAPLSKLSPEVIAARGGADLTSSALASPAIAPLSVPAPLALVAHAPMTTTNFHTPTALEEAGAAMDWELAAFVDTPDTVCSACGVVRARVTLAVSRIAPRKPGSPDTRDQLWLQLPPLQRLAEQNPTASIWELGYACTAVSDSVYVPRSLCYDHTKRFLPVALGWEMANPDLPEHSLETSAEEVGSACVSSAVAQQCDPRCERFLRYVAKHYGCCAPHMIAQRLYYGGSEEAWATAVDPWEATPRGRDPRKAEDLAQRAAAACGVPDLVQPCFVDCGARVDFVLPMADTIPEASLGLLAQALREDLGAVTGDDLSQSRFLRLRVVSSAGFVGETVSAMSGDAVGAEVGDTVVGKDVGDAVGDATASAVRDAVGVQHFLEAQVLIGVQPCPRAREVASALNERIAAGTLSFPVFAAVLGRFATPEEPASAPQPQHAGTAEPPVVATVAALLKLRESAEQDLIPDAVLDALSTATCSEPRCGIVAEDLRVTSGAVLLRVRHERSLRHERLRHERAGRSRVKLRLTPALPPVDAAAAQLAIARSLLNGKLAELCVGEKSVVVQMPWQPSINVDAVLADALPSIPVAQIPPTKFETEKELLHVKAAAWAPSIFLLLFLFR